MSCTSLLCWYDCSWHSIFQWFLLTLYIEACGIDGRMFDENIVEKWLEKELSLLMHYRNIFLERPQWNTEIFMINVSQSRFELDTSKLQIKVLHLHHSVRTVTCLHIRNVLNFIRRAFLQPVMIYMPRSTLH